MLIKLFYILLLFLISTIFRAQKADYEILIDGHVKEGGIRRGIQWPLVDASIRLKTNLGDEIEVKSDTNGYYNFRFYKTVIKTATISILSSRSTHRSNGKCSCYLSSREFGIINIPDSVKPKHFIKDFELYPAEDCCDQIYMPSIKFKNQSLIYDTVFSSHYYNKEDSLLDIPSNGFIQLSITLKENPNIVIQISGHSSFNEKSPMELSQLRAEKVKLELIKLGIKEDRILCKGFADTRLLVKPETLKKAKSNEEKCALHSKNRRCVFSIVHWDYGKTPEQLKKEEEARKTDEKDE